MSTTPSALRALSGHPHAALLDAMVTAAFAAVEPAAAVAKQLGWLTPDALRISDVVQTFEAGAKIHLVAAGKASAKMLEGALAALGGVDHPRMGRVLSVGVAPVDASALGPRHQHFCGGHPLPNAASVAAASAALALADSAGPGDLVLALISGGASAMLCAPRDELTLQQIQACTQVLLEQPVDIATINATRACVDTIKFGGLLRAVAPRRCAALILSDVPGDDLDLVGGGPTRPRKVDPTELREALERAGAWAKLGAEVRAAVSNYAEPVAPPKRRAFDCMVASNISARQAACHAAEALGMRAVDLGGGLRGQTQVAVDALFAELVHPELAAFSPPPRALVIGGETVVQRRGSGRGGRGLNFALRALPFLARQPGCVLLTLATDGADGNSGAAGAVVTDASSRLAAAHGLDPGPYADDDDAASFFDALGDLLVTGPTGTNVCDLVIVIEGEPG